MKILTYLVLTVMLCTVLPVSALAEEVTEPTSTEPPAAVDPVEVVTETTDQGVAVNVYLPATTPENPVAVDPESVDDSGVASTYAMRQLDETGADPVEDPEQQTMKDVVVMVLGDYSPRTQTVTQYLSDGTAQTSTEIVPGVAGMDWEWISGAGLFGLVLYAFLKFVGVLLKNG